jgi:hypothetical protein
MLVAIAGIAIGLVTLWICYGKGSRSEKNHLRQHPELARRQEVRQAGKVAARTDQRNLNAMQVTVAARAWHEAAVVWQANPGSAVARTRAQAAQAAYERLAR